MMTRNAVRWIAGASLILGAVLVNVPYALLIVNFDYPDILRAPTSEILVRFTAGGAGLIWTWLAFAWMGVPILVALLLLPSALRGDSDDSDGMVLDKLALFFGAVSLVAQMLGLLRWPFVVPVLARMYTAPTATAATRDAIVAVFQALHQYVGVVVGEHIGQTFTVFWMVLLSVSLLRGRRVPRWLPWAGFVAAGIYASAQGELLATVLPRMPYWGEAGLVGSISWLAWLISLGVVILRRARRMSH